MQWFEDFGQTAINQYPGSIALKVFEGRDSKMLGDRSTGKRHILDMTPCPITSTEQSAACTRHFSRQRIGCQ